jgi:hypothetical protein
MLLKRLQCFSIARTLTFGFSINKKRMKWSRDHVLTSDLNAETWGLWHGL